MPSTDDSDAADGVADDAVHAVDADDTDADEFDKLDPEAEAAVRRIVREEHGSPLGALMQVLGGVAFALLVVPVLLGLLVVIGVPFVGVAGVALLGLLAAIAYGWSLPPFR